MTKPPENPFWGFSLTVYGRDGVAAACLRLQDRHGIDVNVLLYCCWVARHYGLALDDITLRQILAHVADWKERVVAPLRLVRRALKDGFPSFDPVAREAFRTKIKRVELEAERLQQDFMFRTLSLETDEQISSEELREIMAANVDRYLQGLGVRTNNGAIADIKSVIEASLQDVS